MTDGVQWQKITPHLSSEARREMTEWTVSNVYHKAFIKVLSQTPIVECKNCGDTRAIYVSFCRAGPFRDPPSHKLGEKLTWFEGAEGAGTGWYIVKETKRYECSQCLGNGGK